MKSSQQLIIAAFTVFLMMTLDINVAKAGSERSSNLVITKESTFVSSPAGLPVNNSKDQNLPEIRIALSYSHLPTVVHTRISQELISLSEIFFEIKKMEPEWQPVQVTLSDFFLTLFRVIISPNAP